MKPGKLISTLLILMCCIVITPFASAEETNNSESTTSNDLFKGLMGILQEGIEEFIGNYKGSLGDVKLLERRGNKIVLEVTYDNVKRSDNVYVQGEVRYFGASLEGFSNTLNSVTGSRGKVKLAIGWTQKEDDGWGTIDSEAESDQIRLYLIRKSNPDRPFGEILYDISKTWTHSDEPDEESMVAENDSIELEDDGIDTGSEPSKPSEGVFVKPGTILKPYKPGVAVQKTPPANVPTTTQTTTQAKTPPLVAATKIASIQPRVKSYDCYVNAKLAKWRSSAGKLSFSGSRNNPKGFVRQISRGKLNSGNAAISLIQTNPQRKSGGWIDAHYPLMILSDKMRFKSVVGFLQGANRTKGAIFQVYIKENNKYHRVANNKVSSKKYVSIDADLSAWSGKKVQLVLRVKSGQNYDQDWAVWVKPRLTK
jgi:hypothetical protein